MKRFPIWRVLGIGFLLLLLALGLAGWLVSSHYGQQYAKRLVREQLTRNSELVLADFDVEFSIWRDFPHLTASLSHLTLTDTTAHLALPVMRVGRADLRLEARELLHGRVRVTRLTLHDAAIGQRVDSLGHTWGLRGKSRPATAGKAPKIDLALDSIIVYNFGIFTRNDYIHSALKGRVRQARLTAAITNGQLQVSGRMQGRLVQLRNRSGNLFTDEPVKIWLHYRYAFEQRKGEIYNTRATLNGDTIHISGTHAADLATSPAPPRGTVLDLHFTGSQPLLSVLNVALPPSVRPLLNGAVSSSKAQITYLMSGLSGPKVRPHIVLHFGLRGARVQWPDSSRRIDRWDLQGTYDNGPAHAPQTMSVLLDHCRVYSPVGQLDVAFLLRDFSRPYVTGHLHGRTQLPQLAALLSPERWHARQGIADLDVQLRGLLPALGRHRRGDFRKNMSVRGTATLRDAAFALTGRSELKHLNVRIGMNDSLWRLSNASGMLGGMQFKASAITTYLLDYFTGQHPTTTIKGSFAVDELDLGSLRQILRPGGAVSRTAAARRPTNRTPRTLAERRRLATTLGSGFIPKGMLLDVALHCGRLGLATDTLRDLAVRVRHDGEQVQLTGIRGKLWDGEVTGQAHWPTDSTNRVAPVRYAIDFHFDTLSYKYLIGRLSHPPKRSAKSPRSPAIRELLLAANGKLSYEINSLLLPDGESLHDVRMRFDKEDNSLSLPYLRFNTPQGGVGSGSANVLLAGMHIEAADAKLDLKYPTLDVPQLLRMLASVAPPPADSAAAVARQQARSVRRARRDARQGPASVLATGRFTALLTVQADQVRYAAVRGSKFQLTTHLQAGEAILDNCTVNTLDGRVTLRGRLVTNAGRQHHPLQVQMLLEDIQLPELFGTATAMKLNVLTRDNVRGTLRCAAALRTDLDEKFLPVLSLTNGYLRTDIHDLELIEVEALQDAFKLKLLQKRTAHLFFEPVSSEFVLSRGQLLIPNLRLDSNLTELQINGTYGLDGRSNLYIGMNPRHALFGNNDKRVARIKAGEQVGIHDAKLVYVNLSRDAPHTKYHVKIFQKKEQREAQAALRQQAHQVILTQRLDTTLRLLPRIPVGTPPAQLITAP